MTAPILKVSVLASGSVWLDGEPVSVTDLAADLEKRKADRPVVWYYREAAEGEPPVQAMEVMKMVVDNQLPISLCSKPDFSDYVDRKGVSHRRYATWDGVVAKVREMTTGGQYIGVIRPDRSYLLMAPPPRSAVPPQTLQMMEKMIPPHPARTVAAIADTYFSWKAAGGVPGLAEAGQAVPFFGMLLGMACIGHSVYLFPGTGESLREGCRDAELLLVDDAQIPFLAGDWKAVAGEAMRAPAILIHERTSFKLIPVR